MLFCSWIMPSSAPCNLFYLTLWFPQLWPPVSPAFPVVDVSQKRMLLMPNCAKLCSDSNWLRMRKCLCSFRMWLPFKFIHHNSTWKLDDFSLQGCENRIALHLQIPLQYFGFSLGLIPSTKSLALVTGRANSYSPLCGCSSQEHHYKLCPCTWQQCVVLRVPTYLRYDWSSDFGGILRHSYFWRAQIN